MVINAKEARERVLENKMSKEELESEVIYYLIKIDKEIKIAIQQRELSTSYSFITSNEELINTNLIKINW